MVIFCKIGLWILINILTSCCFFFDYNYNLNKKDYTIKIRESL